MTVKSDMEKVLGNQKWFIGITLFILVTLIGSGVRAEMKTSANKEKIEKIQNDYLPYFAFEYIVESNNKLINILTAIEAKDDPRYQRAMSDWSKLQQEVVKQAGLNKRGIDGNNGQ